MPDFRNNIVVAVAEVVQGFWRTLWCGPDFWGIFFWSFFTDKEGVMRGIYRIYRLEGV